MNIQKPRGQSLVGYRPRGIAPSVFGYSLSFFREYFANRLAKLHILPQLLSLLLFEPTQQGGGLISAMTRHEQAASETRLELQDSGHLKDRAAFSPCRRLTDGQVMKCKQAPTLQGARKAAEIQRSLGRLLKGKFTQPINFFLSTGIDGS